MAGFADLSEFDHKTHYGNTYDICVILYKYILISKVSFNDENGYTGLDVNFQIDCQNRI